MAYADLREFIAALEKNQELKRIPFEVDPILEISAFADRAGWEKYLKTGGGSTGGGSQVAGGRTTGGG